ASTASPSVADLLRARQVEARAKGREKGRPGLDRDLADRAVDAKLDRDGTRRDPLGDEILGGFDRSRRQDASRQGRKADRGRNGRRRRARSQALEELAARKTFSGAFPLVVLIGHSRSREEIIIEVRPSLDRAEFVKSSYLDWKTPFGAPSADGGSLRPFGPLWPLRPPSLRP